MKIFYYVTIILIIAVIEGCGSSQGTAVDTKPVPVKQVSPDYPEIAKRDSIQGTVWVECLVDIEGKVKKAVIMKSEAEILNNSAKEAALHWEFTPALKDNHPVAAWVAIPFRFKLNK